MEKNQEIKVTLEYLKKVVDFSGASLVGKLLKRFEILENKEDIKKVSKELIYEEMRHLRDLLIAFDSGRELTTWKFITKKE